MAEDDMPGLAAWDDAEARAGLIQQISAVLADGVYVLDVAGLVVFVNPEAEHMLGWKESELLGRNGHHVFHYKRPDGSLLPAHDCPVHQTIRTGKTYRSFDDWLVRRDGSCFPVSLVSSPILRDGRVVGSVAAFQDISQRREMEAALRASEQRLTEILEHAPIGMAIATLEGRFLQVNGALCQILDCGREELLRLNMADLLHPADLASCRERDRRLLDGEAKVERMECRYRRQDGQSLWVQVTMSVLRDDHGRPTQFIQQVEDISERKRAEHALRESTARLDALLNAANESVLLVEPHDARILAINGCGAARIGMAPERMVGTSLFAYLSSDVAEDRRGYLDYVAATGEPAHFLDSRAGMHFDNSLYPVKDEAGRVESIAIFARDVTDRRRAERMEEIFRQLDKLLLKWRMDMNSIAQSFCDGVLPVFGLLAAWIGRAEKGGRVSIVAHAGEDSRFGRDVEKLELCRDFSSLCPPIANVIAKGHAERVALGKESACRQCFPEATQAGAEELLLLPLPLRGENWGVLGLFGTERSKLGDTQASVNLATIARRLGMSLEAALQQEWLSLLETALAGVSNGVFITDAGGRIIWANRSLTALSGYESAEIIGRTPALFKSGVQDAEFYRALWETLKAGNAWRGDIVNARKDGRRYTANQTVTPLLDADGRVSHFVAILEDISERKAMEERIYHAAHYDNLTGLPNRGLFFDRLGQALALAKREGYEGALLFLDLDHFKEVNDQLGHAAGDELLVAVSRRLRQLVRESDTVARLAGDEFTIIMPHLQEKGNAGVLAGKIVASLAEPMEVAGHRLRIGVSIGIASFPGQGDTVEKVVSAADKAMYQAKQAGRNTVVACSEAAAGPRGQRA